MTLLSGTSLGLGQLALGLRLLGNVEYRPIVLHKEFQEYLGNFRVVGTFEPAEEFQATGEQGVGYSEGNFAEQNPSELIIGINGDE